MEKNKNSPTSLLLGGVIGGVGLNKTANAIQNRIERGQRAEQQLQDMVSLRKRFNKPPLSEQEVYQRKADIRSKIKDQFNAQQDVQQAWERLKYGQKHLFDSKTTKAAKQQAALIGLKGIGRLAVIPVGIVGGATIANSINQRLKRKK